MARGETGNVIHSIIVWLIPCASQRKAPKKVVEPFEPLHEREVKSKSGCPGYRSYSSHKPEGPEFHTRRVW